VIKKINWNMGFIYEKSIDKSLLHSHYKPIWLLCLKFVVRPDCSAAYGLCTDALIEAAKYLDLTVEIYGE